MLELRDISSRWYRYAKDDDADGPDSRRPVICIIRNPGGGECGKEMTRKGRPLRHVAAAHPQV